jgi:NAD(P)-dependent dehydrogenase (short-subunit alcohol dehydrogenase family)
MSAHKMTDVELADQVAVVTGATSGIGHAIAEALLASGTAVWVIGRRGEKLRELFEGRPRVTVYQADLTDDGQIDRLRDALARQGGIDILVHAAAIIKLSPFSGALVDDLDSQYRTNVRAPYVLTQALLPLLSKRGQVVFLNSSAGLVARAGVGQYGATKHALKAIADSLREELHPSGRRVLSVFAGRTATPMQEAIHQMENRPYDPARYMDPAEVARAVVDALAFETAEIKEINLRPRFD